MLEFGLSLSCNSGARTISYSAKPEVQWPLESPVGTKMAEGGRVAAVFGPVKLAMNDSVFPEGISQKSDV